MSIYMQTPHISGNVSAEDYKGWIELTNVDFSAKRNITQKIGHQTDRESSIPNISQLTLAKLTDKSSPLLFEALLDGSSMDKVTIAVCRNGKNQKLASQIILHDVMVSYYEEQITAEGDNASTEYLSLSFTEIEKRYIPYNSNGDAGSAISTGYNLSTASVS